MGRHGGLPPLIDGFPDGLLENFMFIDNVTIQVQAGNGGRGCVSFRREKFVPLGGPDGGDGGRGADIYLIATTSRNTLVHFQHRRHFKSEHGGHGGGSNRTGKSGKDLRIPVPVGTIITNAETGDLIADLDVDGAQILVARGGKGGKGNARFATPTEQAPRTAQPGEHGESQTLDLELKLIADVGLLGFPNAGKSTLLSKISAAKPKIASYPFTTLQPVLGVVDPDDNTTFIVADIPGLIEGASHGVGLGLQFLRHIERTRILLHLVDVSLEAGGSAVNRYQIVRKELSEYGKGLSQKPQVLVATKIDQANDAGLEELKALAVKRSIPFAEISAVTGNGISGLVQLARDTLRRQNQKL